MKINGMKIEEFLKDKNVYKIYVGKDNCCRCGCGGTYYYKQKIQDKLNFDKYIQEAFKRCNSMRESSQLALENFAYNEFKIRNNKEGYINIPMPKNKCYCIYYKK